MEDGIAQSVEGRASPVGDLGDGVFLVFLCLHRFGNVLDAQVILDALELLAERRVQGWVEVTLEDFLDQPATHERAADGGHLFHADGVCVVVDIAQEPLGETLPVFADVERKVFDGAV